MSTLDVPPKTPKTNKPHIRTILGEQFVEFDLSRDGRDEKLLIKATDFRGLDLHENRVIVIFGDSNHRAITTHKYEDIVFVMERLS